MSRFATVLAAQAQAITIGWQVYDVARRTSSVTSFNATTPGNCLLMPRICRTGIVADRLSWAACTVV